MIQPSDDRRHQPESTDILWGESWYFNAYDPQQDAALFVRMGLYPNRVVANMAVLLAVAGRGVYNRSWHALPLPDGDIDADSGLSVGGLTFTAIELLERYQIVFTDDVTPLAVNLVWEAIMPAHNAMAGVADNSAASFHLEQAGRVSGTIRLRQREWHIQGVGNRDHSTGTRNWSAFAEHQVAWPIFDDGTALGIIRVRFDGGSQADLCWAWDGETVHSLRLEHFDEVLNDEGRASSARVAAVDDRGVRYELTCTRKAVCHWPFDGYLLNEGAFEFRLSDGRIGYGLLELGVRAGHYQPLASA